MFKRLEIIVNLLKKTKFKKILIITHGGTIFKLIKLLFNISEINGNYKFGANCHITYIIYNKRTIFHQNIVLLFRVWTKYITFRNL